MTAILRIESRKLVRSSAVLIGVFAVLSTMYLSIYPEFKEEAEELMEAFPDFIFDMFGLEAIHTIEGFLAAEVYAFFWILLVGLYFAYISAGFVSKDIEERKMDLTLSNPVTRESVILQKVGALWVPLLLLNGGVILFLYIGTYLIDETLDITSLVMVHLLSIPYLLVCAVIGLVTSIVIKKVRTSQVWAIGIVFILWLIESISNITVDYDWIGYVSPSNYYDPTQILVNQEYAFLDAGILLIVFVILLILSIILFKDRDI
ncbi:ABC transporter permease subunit [Methanonatronarchaeum sp. AMET-Sl]|uniref:ABC transporter permease subunit n=1 Tax=Methanonatronarchaeum sp. AMET-Sl TaxID=3037654 RepID=UPI00244E113F|nr:ABC transporter permease subunit [Methanonatronarchaeum sp. AMET-Sl]WGI17361.1 ABC transporter permease subunit [Methanonatronarchaeum sp. AMET-Sl]